MSFQLTLEEVNQVFDTLRQSYRICSQATEECGALLQYRSHPLSGNPQYGGNRMGTAQ